VRSKWIVAAGLGGAAVIYFGFGLHEVLTLEAIKSARTTLQARVDAQPVVAASAFFLVYVAVTGISLPGAALLTLLGGALFGFWLGLLIVSFASSVGATLAFLAARHLFRDSVQNRFGRRLAAINEGVARDGAFYLFALRLVPIIPFFAINALVGLTPMRAWTFYWVSQVGMLAGTAVYVNAGTQLASIEHLGGILSPSLLLAFALLAAFPFVARGALRWLQTRRVYAPWRVLKPRHFDYNVAVIGAGSAGLVTAYISAAVRAKVALIEAHRMGGDCLNTGCVPSKALIRSARVLAEMRTADRYGITATSVQCDFARVMARVRDVVRAVEPHDSVERYTALGVDCIAGRARLTSPWTVEVTAPDGTTRSVSARSIVIATGARPTLPPIPGLDEAAPLTSDTVWDLGTLPPRLAILGGGPIGCELAQCFARFGSEVTLIEMSPRLLGKEDSDVSTFVASRLARDGVRVLTSHHAIRVESNGQSGTVICESHARVVEIAYDRLLVAVGRTARTEGLGIESLGLVKRANGTLETDSHLRTRYPNIFACGDVTGPWQLTHAGAHQAWYATVNALFGRLRSFRVDDRIIPWVTFTDPEVARVGLSEDEARRRGIPVEVTRYDLAELDRAIVDGHAEGWVKVLTPPGKDTILGASIVGEHAGELLAEFVLAMKHGVGLNDLLGTIHSYPTFAEANKYVAGAWKRAHQPARLLDWVRRYHDWMRR
jgi:pyruvate/2-oxoglutarate dehydrogenase complex dihydrolipoamide dehydrogenase (E3) component/uncharacterized membrane protein YdjX (TVP38/TMEM64 family)